MRHLFVRLQCVEFAWECRFPDVLHSWIILFGSICQWTLGVVAEAYAVHDQVLLNKVACITNIFKIKLHESS